MKNSGFFYVLILMLVAGISTSVQAQTADFVCYWKMPNGTIKNLSQLCGTSSFNPSPPISTDDAFLTSFKSLASRYSTPISRALNQELSQNQESLIAEAQGTCRVLQFGGKSAEAIRRRAIAARNPTPEGNAKREIINTLARSYYCRQFAN